MVEDMSLEIVCELPPADIYEACDKKFGIRGRKGVVWTVGGKLYNPDAVKIDPALFAHEQVHSDRQLAAASIEAWWRDYLENPQFRFDEELIAHQVEWKVAKQVIPSYERRVYALNFIIDRLSGPLYGNMIERRYAKRLILGSGSI